MGYYIQTAGNKGKANYLVTRMGGKLVPQPKSFEEIPTDKALIVVLDNGPFEAAGLAFNPAELQAFTRPDGRDKQFVLLDRKTAYIESGYLDGIRDEFGGQI